jgi:hypothetical protein
MAAALKKIADEQPVERSIIDVERPKNTIGIDAALMKIVAATKSSPLKIMREYTSLAFGPGRVSFAEYHKLRLFDDVYYEGQDKRAVIGWKRNSQINLIANYRYDWWGMLSDKIASESYLKTYGFPTIAMQAIYSDRAGASSKNLLSDADELRAFLMNESLYPMFGKPTDGRQSLGSIALARFNAATRMLETTDKREVRLEDFIANVTQHYSGGYVFQQLAVPHVGVRAICGDRIATCRIVTIALEGKPQVFRACWKIPAGVNTADNFWRPGNMLAQIDVTSGRVLRAMSGTGVELVEHTHHPDTGAFLIGAEVPLWPQLISTVLEAAKLMQHVAMIGWDVTALESGPVIVEMNETPDLFLNQIADKCGVLDDDFNRFLVQQKKNRVSREKMLAESHKIVY